MYIMVKLHGISIKLLYNFMYIIVKLHGILIQFEDYSPDY